MSEWISMDTPPEVTYDADGGCNVVLAYYKEPIEACHRYDVAAVPWVLNYRQWYSHWMPVPAAPEGADE